MDNLAYSENQDEMQHDAAFHQHLHCLLRSKQPSRTEIHHNLEKPLRCKMDNPILNVSICIGKSIRIKRVKLIHSHYIL